MKKIFSLILVAVMILTLVSCGNASATTTTATTAATTAATTKAATTASPTTTAKTVTYKIGYAFNAVDENTQRSLKGWNEAVKAWNSSHTDIKIDFFYTDAQTSVETQLSNVETMIQQKPNAIILASVDTKGCIPAAEAIHKAGIFCIETRGMVSDAVDLKWQGFDEYSMSIMSADIYKAYIEKNPDKVLNAVLIYGNPAQANQLHRMDGFKELAAKYPNNIKILAENYGNWKTDAAQVLMEDWIQLYGKKINVVCSASDAMALGAVNALKAAGFKTGDVMITAVDGTKDGLSLIESGWQTATVKMLMTSQAAGQLEIVVKCLTGEFKDKSYNGGSKFAVNVTKENLEKYKTVD